MFGYYFKGIIARLVTLNNSELMIMGGALQDALARARAQS